MWRKSTEEKTASNAPSAPALTPAAVEIRSSSPEAKSASARQSSVSAAGQSSAQATAVPATPASQPNAPAPAPVAPYKPLTTGTSLSATAPSQFASGLKIRGEISGSSDLYLDGEVQGNVQLPNAKVTIGPNGRVQADIEAREIIIQGWVQGNLKAGEIVSLGSASHVQGSMLTPRIAMEDGARLRGKVEMTRRGEIKTTAITAVAAAAGSGAATQIQAGRAEKV